MITEQKLSDLCQTKGLHLLLSQAKTTRKVYSVVKLGDTKMLTVGFLGHCHEFVKAYVSEVKRTSEYLHPGTGTIQFP